jgi:hypothetical protein
MKRIRWQILLGLGLMLLSAVLYFVHYLIFKDAHHIFLYLLGDIAFVPIEVLFVTLIIHQLLNTRDKRSRLEKLNMVIGAFFSEVGTKLLGYLSDFDPQLENIRKDLLVSTTWSVKEFLTLSKRLRHYDYRIDIHKVVLKDLQKFLVGKRDFLVRLLENPSLLEHETFTELLRAVFHLTEELESREDLRNLPPTDYAHLAGDTKRAYGLLVYEWLDYMKYLKYNYPYLFSLAIRTNPFDKAASPIVR